MTGTCHHGQIFFPWDGVLWTFLSGLVWNCDASDLTFPSSWDDRLELLCQVAQEAGGWQLVVLILLLSEPVSFWFLLCYSCTLWLFSSCWSPLSCMIAVLVLAKRWWRVCAVGVEGRFANFFCPYEVNKKLRNLTRWNLSCIGQRFGMSSCLSLSSLLLATYYKKVRKSEFFFSFANLKSRCRQGRKWLTVDIKWSSLQCLSWSYCNFIWNKQHWINIEWPLLPL
jgi:hypothetical protein